MTRPSVYLMAKAHEWMFTRPRLIRWTLVVAQQFAWPLDLFHRCRRWLRGGR